MRTLQSEVLKQTYTDEAHGFSLLLTVEKNNGQVVAMNASGNKTEGQGTCYFAYVPGHAYPNSVFNQCPVNAELQAYVQAEFEAIAAVEVVEE